MRLWWCLFYTILTRRFNRHGVSVGHIIATSSQPAFTACYAYHILILLCIVYFMVATNEHGYVPFVAIKIRPFPHSWVITGVTNVEHAYPSGAFEFTPVLVGFVSLVVFSFLCNALQTLFVLLSIFIWLLCCLSFFDLRLLITPFRNFLVSISAIPYTWSYRYQQIKLGSDLLVIYQGCN